jgi:TRAP-type mannitol/chloroaromatic compound transport system permease large subunit
MLRTGYDKRLATGTICASGTLGQIIPPSIVLVLLGDILQGASAQARNTLMAEGRWDVVLKPVNVLDLFAGALLPGLMLVGMYMTWIVLVSTVQPHKAPRVQNTVARRDLWKRGLKVLVPPGILILAVLGSILVGAAPPTEAAAVGAVGALLLAGMAQPNTSPWPIYAAGIGVVVILIVKFSTDFNLHRDVVPTGVWAAAGLVVAGCLALTWGVGTCVNRTWRSGILTEVVRSSMQITVMVFVILLGASVFSLVFRALGGEEIVRDVLGSLPGGTTGAVVAVMALMFFLGFFLDYIEIIFVVVPIVGPILLTMGVDPVWLGVMMSVNLQMSFLTPPFGFALFYLRGVAPPSVSTGDIYMGIIPFVLIQILALAVLWTFPGIATWLPSQIG